MSWILFLGLTILFWGSYNLFYKAVLSTELNIFLSLAIMSIVSGTIAIPFLLHHSFNEEITLSLKGVLLSTIMGICQGLGTIFFFYAFKNGAQASLAISIFSVGALLVGTIGGILFFTEELNLKMVLGVSLGILSIIFLTFR